MLTRRVPEVAARPRLSAIPGPWAETESPVHVLVVDDEAALRDGIERVLRARGIDVTTADGGATALERLEARPDVVLVDHAMPGMDGLQVLGRVKEIQPDVAVILMTAFADVEAPVSAMRAGAHNFLRKPLESDDGLALAVVAAAEHRRLSNRVRSLEQRLEAKERFGELAPLLLMPYAQAKKRMLGLFDGAYVGAVMERAGGNTSEAARQAGLDRSNFRRIARKTREG
jgi:DNA-binding NtrC family response regulator